MRGCRWQDMTIHEITRSELVLFVRCRMISMIESPPTDTSEVWKSLRTHYCFVPWPQSGQMFIPSSPEWAHQLRRSAMCLSQSQLFRSSGASGFFEAFGSINIWSLRDEDQSRRKTDKPDSLREPQKHHAKQGHSLLRPSQLRLILPVMVTSAECWLPAAAHCY